MPTRMTIDECIALLERMRDIYGDNIYICEKPASKICLQDGAALDPAP